MPHPGKAILGDKLFEVIRNEHSPHKQLEGWLVGVVVVHEVKGRTRRDKQDGLELNISLSLEVGVGQRLLTGLQDS